MSPMTSALISYWQRLPAESPVLRRAKLAALREDVRAGRRPPEALVTAILGDIDEDIVHAAACAYLEGCETLPVAHRAVVVDAAMEWIRRGLALNRGSVFAALLGTCDQGVLERLAAQRLSLSAEEVEVVCRQLPPGPVKPIVAFLREWAELVEGSVDGTLSRQRELLSAALDAATSRTDRLVAA